MPYKRPGSSPALLAFFDAFVPVSSAVLRIPWMRLTSKDCPKSVRIGGVMAFWQCWDTCALLLLPHAPIGNRDRVDERMLRLENSRDHLCTRLYPRNPVLEMLCIARKDVIMDRHDISVTRLNCVYPRFSQYYSPQP